MRPGFGGQPGQIPLSFLNDRALQLTFLECMSVIRVYAVFFEIHKQMQRGLRVVPVDRRGGSR